MTPQFILVERVPTVEAYARLIAAVGWRDRQPEAIALALQHSLFAVCAETDGTTIGFGRVIGDAGIHLYLTDVVVHPSFQGRGIGSALVTALTAWVEAFPFPNTIVSVLPTPGLVGFYQRHGYTTQPSASPVMLKWVKPTA